MFGNALAEHRARPEAPGHRLKRLFSQTDRPHAMMNAARPQTTLRDLAATPFATQQIFYRHPHIGERHFCVTMRGMIIAIAGEVPLALDARRIAYGRASFRERVC